MHRFCKLIVNVLCVALLAFTQPLLAQSTQHHHAASHTPTKKKHVKITHHAHHQTKIAHKTKHTLHASHHTHHQLAKLCAEPRERALLNESDIPEPNDDTLASDTTSLPKPASHDLALINELTLSQPSFSSSIVNSVEKNLVEFVHKTISTLHYSSYKLGGRHFDTERGVYIVDCSSFVDHVLENVYPNAFSSLVNASGADTPATQHYYDFFRDLSDDTSQYWNKVNEIEELRSGDVLVFRYKNSRGAATGGHVMVVMDKPVRVSDVYFVRVADSASSGHSEDTRQPNKSGIGIGTLLLKANPKTGQPSAFAWGVGGYWKKNVKFAMARPIEITA